MNKQFKCLVSYLAITICSLACLYQFWHPSGVTVKFQYKVQRPIDFQVFYKTSNEKEWSHTKKIRSKELGDCSFFLPVKKLSGLRLDIGEQPGKAEIRQLQLKGDKTLKINQSSSFQKNNIETVSDIEDGFTITSLHHNPYIIYKSSFHITSGNNRRFLLLPFLLISLGTLGLLTFTREIQTAVKTTAKTTNQYEKSFYLSILTVLSSFAVIMLHCNGIFWSHPKNIWLSSCIIETVFYFAVPVFFMISGSTLIDYKKRYSTKTYFLKRATRTVIPFCIWSIIALLFWQYQHPHINLSLRKMISGILETRFCSIYWFFIPLFAIYLSLPAICEIQNKKKTFAYMVTFAIITISGSLCLNDFGIKGLPHSLRAPICSGYLVYPLLGYLLHHINVKRNVRRLIYLAGLVGFVAHFYASYKLTPIDGDICRMFKNYMHITTIAQACAIFLFIKYNTNRLQSNNTFTRIVLFIQPATLSIYLIHIYIHQYFTQFNIGSTLTYRTLGAIGLFILLTVIIRLLQKIRFLRIFFP